MAAQTIRLFLEHLRSGKPITIGRGDFRRELGFAITDPTVSRNHCVIERSESGLLVRDLESGMGTYVRDRAGFFCGVSAAGRDLDDRINSIWLGHRVQLRVTDEDLPDNRCPSFAELLSALESWEVIVGRSFPTRRGVVGICLTDKKISKEHAMLRLVDASEHYIEVVDLDSANGVLVNKSRIRGQVTLRPGDLLEIGSTFHVEIPTPNRRQRKPTVIRMQEQEAALLSIERELTAARQRLWELEVGESLSLGRSAAAKEQGVDIGDKFVSSVHLRISREPNEQGLRTYHIDDCSSNGTWVGGRPLPKSTRKTESAGVQLPEGETLVLGHPESHYRLTLPGRTGRLKRAALGGAHFDELFNDTKKSLRASRPGVGKYAPTTESSAQQPRACPPVELRRCRRNCSC